MIQNVYLLPILPILPSLLGKEFSVLCKEIQIVQHAVMVQIWFLILQPLYTLHPFFAYYEVQT